MIARDRDSKKVEEQEVGNRLTGDQSTKGGLPLGLRHLEMDLEDTLAYIKH